MKDFEEITPYALENAMKLVGKDWMLITAQDQEGGKVNAMTASWGSLGVLWNECVCTCFVRPQRYTFDLLEEEERFSVAFLPESYRSALGVCGRISGRDHDKLAEAGLSADETDGVPVVKEAALILVCRKLYADDLKEDRFFDPAMLAHYEKGDFHRMYICKIEKVYRKITV